MSTCDSCDLSRTALRQICADLTQTGHRFGAFGGLAVHSPRPYRGIGELEYPFHDWTAIVTTCGRICYEKRKVNLSTVFPGQKVGVSQVGEHLWLVSFMDYDLGYFDDETCRLEPIENPFWRKVLPM